jgi:hypothetical protein
MTFKERVKILFSGVWDFIGPLCKVFLSVAGQAVAASAMRAVIQAQSAPVSTRAKFAIAQDYILQDLKEKGVEVGMSVINAAIEVAVQKLKEAK